MTPNPPHSFLRFFRWFCHPELRDYIEGDLVELYRESVKVSGSRKADWKFRLEVLKLLRPGIVDPSRDSTQQTTTLCTSVISKSRGGIY